MDRLILSFNNLAPEDSDLVGVQAEQLGIIARGQLPLLPGFVVTSAGYRLFLVENNLERTINQLLHTVNYSLPESILQVSHLINREIKRARVPQILHTYVEKENVRNRFTHTHARLQALPALTFPKLPPAKIPLFFPSIALNPTITSVEDNFKRLFSLPFQPHVLYFMNKYTVPIFSIGIALFIQEQVPVEKSGKIFTFNPLALDKNSMLINAALGYPHPHTSSDSYILSKNSEIILEREIALQHFLVTQENNSRRPLYLLPKTANMPKLTLSQLIKLCRIGKKLEKLLYYPQEIDWIISNDHIYITDVHRLDPQINRQIKQSIINSSPSQKSLKQEGIIKIIKSRKDAYSVKKGDIIVIQKPISPIPFLANATAILSSNISLQTYANAHNIPFKLKNSSSLQILRNGQIYSL